MTTQVFQLNDDKKEVLLISSEFQLQRDFPLPEDGDVDVIPTKSAQNIGVLHAHVKHVAKQTFNHIRKRLYMLM